MKRTILIHGARHILLDILASESLLRGRMGTMQCSRRNSYLTLPISRGPGKSILIIAALARRFLGLDQLLLIRKLFGGLSLGEFPGLDLTFKQFVDLGRRASGENRLASWLNKAFFISVSLREQHNLPTCLRKQQPGANDKRKADSRVEPAGLEAPVPLVGVDHVRGEHVHHHSCNASACCAKACSMGS